MIVTIRVTFALMPKVLRIINRFNLGGPTYNASYLTRYLPDDFETMLIGGVAEPDEESSEFIVQKLGVPYRLIPEMKRSLNWFNDRAAYNIVRGLIRDFRPDIVHTHASKAGGIGRLAAKAENVPVVIHTFHGHVFQDYFGPLKTAFYKTIERRLAKDTTRIVAISNIQKDDISRIHHIAPADKVAVIPLGFDLDRFTIDNELHRERFRKQYQLQDDELVIGHIARFAPVKEHGIFIKAFAGMSTINGQRVRAVLVGDGETRAEAIATAAAEGLVWSSPEYPNPDADIIFTSWIREVDTCIPAFEVLALSSRCEGTPVSLIEAQASGVPVVSTRVGGVQDIIIEGETGISTHPGSIENLRSALVEILSNKERRSVMGANARKFALSRFHYSRMVGEHADLYRSLL